MRVGDNPSIGPDFNPQGSTLTIDEQIINELNVPVQKGDWKGANARRDAVKAIFDKLSPDQAKELYQRLENYNWKDNLNDRFHGTFEDYSINLLKKSLKARFEPQNGGTTAQTTEAPGNASGAEKKSDVGNVGKTRQDQLNEQLDPKGPDAPLKIAQRKDLDESAKGNAIREAIRTASPADFQKMVEASAKWPKDVQDRFDKELGGGFAELARRIPKDLKPDQQLEMLKRMHSGGHFYAVTEAIVGADPKVLNQVAADFKSFPGFDLNNRASRDIIYALTTRAKDLSPDNQRKLADGLINDPMTHPSSDLTRSLNLTTMFEGMNEAQSRDLFAHIQQNGDLKKMLSYFHEKEPIRFGEDFRGLGQKELQAIKQTFEQLAVEAPSTELAKIYRENAAAAQRRMDFLK
jgi:hypothetical protein